jgi:esterase/lipase
MWGAIRADVISDLKDMKKQTGLDLLYITGISLGGGLAGISYIDLL